MPTVYIVLSALFGGTEPRVFGVFQTFEAMVETIRDFPKDHGLDDEELDKYGWQPVGHLFTVMKSVLY